MKLPPASRLRKRIKELLKTEIKKSKEEIYATVKMQRI
jgi:hypothetical protein